MKAMESRKSLKNSIGPDHHPNTLISIVSPSTNKNSLIQTKPTCPCDGGCSRCQSALPIKPKLTLVQPDNKCEYEAQWIADQVVRMPDSLIQKKPSWSLVNRTSCRDGELGEGLIQEKTFSNQITPLCKRPTECDSKSADLSPSISSDIRSLQSGGRPMTRPERDLFEPCFAADFSDVRIHNNIKGHEIARSLKARAFTTGQNIVFGSGEYSLAGVAGKKLMAHELTHVMQQRTGGLQETLVQRSCGHCETHQESEAGPDTSETFWEERNVERIVVFCDDMHIAFIMEEGTLIYELTDCDVSPGTYVASVEVSGNNLMLWYGDVEGENRETASFRYRIRSGQPNPATLLRNQTSVPLHVRRSDESSIDAEAEHERTVCLYEIPYRQIFPLRNYSAPLFDERSFREEVLSETISLEEIGDININLIAHGRISGNFSSSYGPGALTNICLNAPRIGSRLAIGGQANFNCPVDASVIFPLEGGLDLQVNYMGILPIADIDGRINGSCRANAHTEFNAALGVTWDRSQSNPWSFSSSVNIPINASLNADLGASVALSLFSYRIWNAAWNNPLINLAWQSGITIGEDLASIEVDQGDIEEISDVSDSISRRADASHSGGGSILSSLSNLMQSIFNLRLADITMQAAPTLGSDLRTYLSPDTVPPHLTAAQQTVSNIYNRIGPAFGYRIAVCDNNLSFQGSIGPPRPLWRLVLHAGGALTDPSERIIWVHVNTVNNGGGSRSWGTRLNLNQVIAHEIGHANLHGGGCAEASELGGYNPHLTPQERQGLIHDANMIRIQPAIP